MSPFFAFWFLIYIVEMSATELKSVLNDLYISAARELEVDSGRKVDWSLNTVFSFPLIMNVFTCDVRMKAVVIFVPFRQLKDFHKIQTRLVRELEKVMFAGSNIYDLFS